jgi:hypothetical protein
LPEEVDVPVLAQSVSDLKQRELKDKAHKLMLKGKFNAALAVYDTLVHDHPKDAALRLHHAELCQKVERPQAAVTSYLSAARLFSEAGYVARAKAAVGCGLRIAPHDQGLLKELRLLNSDPGSKVKTDPPQKVESPKLALVPWTQPIEAEQVRAREVAEKKPEPSHRTSNLRLVPVADNLFDDEAVTEPYFPLPDWLEDTEAEADEADEPLAPQQSRARPPLRPGVDDHFPKRTTVSQRGPAVAKRR